MPDPVAPPVMAPVTGSAAVGTTVWRILRASLAMTFANALAVGMQDARLAWAAPIFLGVGKAVRDRWPGKFEWLPF